MTTHLLAWLLSYLFNALWQIPLLFAAAWIVARALRRLGPQLEHRIWVGALLLQIVLPACNLRIVVLWSALLNLLPAHSASAGGSVRVLLGPATIARNALQLPSAWQTGIAIAWASIVFYFLMRLAWGFAQTHKFARTAMPGALPGDIAERWAGHCARVRIAPLPGIAISAQATAPVAIGVRRGIVLLPPHLLDNAALGDVDAVLAHELAHIVRHDFQKNLLYSLLSLPIAWHPLTWRARTHVAETRELICDDVAATAVAGRRQYAQSLLRLASSFARQPRLAALPAIGILDFNTSSALERRVMSLTRKHISLSTTHRVLLAVACSFLAIATCTSALALHTDVSALSPTTENSPPTKVHVKSDIMSGQKISGENPTYPPEAREKKIQGKVVLDAVISKEGEIEHLSVVTSPDESLSKSAIEAVRTWRYRPYLLNGDPVEVETTINVIYNLAG